MIIVAGQKIVAYLKGKDPDNDYFTYSLKTQPSSYFNVSLSSSGQLIITDICAVCIGTTSFEIELKDSQGLSRSYTLTVKLTDRNSAKLDLHSDDAPPRKSALQRWHIYLIILAVITSVGAILSLVMYNCCSFSTDIYTAPLKRPNKVVAESSKNSEMNPYAHRSKRSLVVREAVRSGAADGTPYYGVRKSGVWVPTAPEDNVTKGQPTPLRLMSLSEDPEVARLRSGSLAPIRSKKLRPITEKVDLDQVPWQDISAPRH
ncbi:uncharacterized protein [Watersipora subatra]|uniref:uncharacterized protein n=1 Tax=Watersipora subatra TaxID=2589382 RepID=UPI00355BB4C2